MTRYIVRQVPYQILKIRIKQEEELKSTETSGRYKEVNEQMWKDRATFLIEVKKEC